MVAVEKPCVKLVACRANTGMTQKEFAEAVGVDPNTIYNWEKGITEPGYQALTKISELSGVPLGLIFLPEQS
jgi:transcriptional regulator with XRE-family HTH domain